MKPHCLCLPVLYILLWPAAFGRWVQTNVPKDQKIAHGPLMGTRSSQETPRELLGLPTQHRMRSDLLRCTDTLRAMHMMSPLPDGRSIPNGTQQRFPLLRRKSSPQSQIYVVDTALVRSTRDTTRHLYSFNAKAKRTSDLTQGFKGDHWVDTLRETNTYDASKNMLTDLYENWSNGQWVGNMRYTYTYDASKNMLTDLYEGWSYGQWGNGWRHTYTYDANGNMLSWSEGDWSFGQWVDTRRASYTYDASKNMLTDLYEQWSNGQWVNVDRYTYTYDTTGNRLSEYYQRWSNGQLANWWRYTYTYDANGKMLSSQLKTESVVLIQTYTYDANGNMLSRLYEQWQNGHLSSGRDTYTYDANGKQTSYLYELWFNGQWVNSIRYTWTFDALGNMLTDVYEQWSNGQWVNVVRYTYTYDASGNMLSGLHEDWSNGQWVNVFRVAYTYDAHGNVTSFWAYSYLTSIDIWTPTDLAWGGVADSADNTYNLENGYNVNLAYEVIVTGITSQSWGKPASYPLSQNYPNPFNPTTNIQFTIVNRQWTIVKVFDVLGRDVATLVNEVKQPGTYRVVFDGSNLSSGVYFYQLKAGAFVETKKLLLMR